MRTIKSSLLICAGLSLVIMVAIFATVRASRNIDTSDARQPPQGSRNTNPGASPVPVAENININRNSRTAQQRWEYRVIKFRLTPSVRVPDAASTDTIERELNRRGTEGWEVVSATTTPDRSGYQTEYTMVLKRLIE